MWKKFKFYSIQSTNKLEKQKCSSLKQASGNQTKSIKQSKISYARKQNKIHAIIKIHNLKKQNKNRIE